MKEEINSSIFIVADFGRFAPSVARLQKDIVAPYAHVVASYANDNISDPFEARTTLLFFKGRIRRKDVCISILSYLLSSFSCCTNLNIAENGVPLICEKVGWIFF